MSSGRPSLERCQPPPTSRRHPTDSAPTRHRHRRSAVRQGTRPPPPDQRGNPAHLRAAPSRHLQRSSSPAQRDRDRWPEAEEHLSAVFRQRTRGEWWALLEGTDTCFVPVSSMGEASEQPPNKARGGLSSVGGVVQPSPAPRFDRTPAGARRPHRGPGSTAMRCCGSWA
ncbi:CoA transferase [Streptomyces sp. 5-8]|uniref:CoA transferase n=1 Tax=Streptomyces musisoli TaxID=2802280 RepID=A0ABS1NWB2_9ACTN|nr:CoA transferase [Streptomyces musisoli]